METENIKTKKIKYDLFIAILIVITPFLSFIYMFFDANVDNISFLGFNYSHEYKSNSLMMWTMMNSMVPAILMVLFFLHTKYSWRYLLFFPIGLEFISTLFVFSEDMSYSNFLLSSRGLFSFVFIGFITTTIDLYLLKKYSKTNLSINPNALIRLYSGLYPNTLKKRAQEIIELKGRVSNKKYSCHLFYFRSLIQRKIQEAGRSIRIIEQRNIKPAIKPIIVVGILLFAVTALCSHLLIPKDSENIEILGIEISNFGFRSFRSFVWYFNRKFAYIIILVIWLIQCKHWWKWAILSPISLYSLQFSEIFLDQRIIEEESNLILLPLIIVTVFFLFRISISLNKAQKIVKLNGDLDKEFTEIIEELSKTELQKVNLN